MPHQPAMLDDYHEPGVREVYHQMASQYSGKTFCMNVDAMYVIDQLRQNILVIRATKETATEWMRDKFLPMVRATPKMEGLLRDPRKRDSESTSLNRKFPGGSIKVIGAKSPAAFRGSSAPHIRSDEIDAYENTKEGDPIKLGDRAAKTFSNATKVRISTPTFEGFSRINAGFKSGDMQYFFLPCKCCGEFQHLKTEQLKFSFTKEELARFTPESDFKTVANSNTWEIGTFPDKATELAIYVCEHCHHGWTDQDRMDSYFSGHPDNPPIIVDVPYDYPESDKFQRKELRAGWRATAKFKGIRSRHLNGMYASIGLEKSFKNYLHMFAEQFIEAVRGGRETLVAWTNMFKNEPFEEAGEKVDWKALYERVEDYGMELPLAAVITGASVDIQADRVEIFSAGLGEGSEVWALEYKVIYGDFDMPEMQERVADYLINKRFSHKVLGQLAYEFVCVDSGHQTKVRAVFQFCKRHKLRNFWAVKGFDNTLGSVYTTRQEKVYGINVFNFNVDHLKSVIYGSLRNTEPGANYIHFPKNSEFGVKYFMGLCSEKRMTKKTAAGGLVFQWKIVAGRKRNEPLDLMDYFFGGCEILRKAGRMEFVSRQWERVKKALGGTEVAQSKDYQLKPAPEAKLPELKFQNKTRGPAQVGRRRIRRMGGFNPFRL